MFTWKNSVGWMFIAVVVVISVYFIIAGGPPLSLVSWWTPRGARQLKELHYIFGGCINANVTIIFFLSNTFSWTEYLILLQGPALAYAGPCVKSTQHNHRGKWYREEYWRLELWKLYLKNADPCWLLSTSSHLSRPGLAAQIKSKLVGFALLQSNLKRIYFTIS